MSDNISGVLLAARMARRQSYLGKVPGKSSIPYVLLCILNLFRMMLNGISCSILNSLTGPLSRSSKFCVYRPVYVYRGMWCKKANRGAAIRLDSPHPGFLSLILLQNRNFNFGNIIVNAINHHFVDPDFIGIPAEL